MIFNTNFDDNEICFKPNCVNSDGSSNEENKEEKNQENNINESRNNKKEVDGWLTARRRDFGHDFAIIQLAFPCRLNGICIDASNFQFDLPKKLSIEAANLPNLENQILMSGCLDFRGVGNFGNSYEFSLIEKFEKKIDHFLKKNKTNWIEILPATSIFCYENNQKNYFEFFGETTQKIFTHIRINLFPDGGLARLRVYGEIMADLQNEVETGEQFDLQSEEKGASIILYSNCNFGHPKNLLKRNLALSKLDGWQTPRNENRPYIFHRNFVDLKNYEFVIIKLAHRAIVDEIQIDCSIFSDEIPQKISVQFLDRADIFTMDYREQQILFEEDEKKRQVEELNFQWREIGIVNMNSHHVKKLKLNELENLLVEDERIATHVKLLLFPDGGIGRIKIIGRIFDPLRSL